MAELERCLPPPLPLSHGQKAMSTEPIKAGDTVRLKSGGPVMTVAWVEDGQAYCQWFEGKKVEGQKFGVMMLDAAQP